MYQSFSILYQVLETSSGTVFKVEEKFQNISKIYYAFQFIEQQIMSESLRDNIQKLEQSNHRDLFRKYIKMHKDDQKQLYLFDYIEGSQFLDQKIKDYGKLTKSFVYSEIQQYLKNLLLALYQLHSKDIPGRVFSTFNIVVQPGEKIVLMDFGFEPEIEKNHLDILAPPEYLKKIINKENYDKFDLKFDSWLVGAFLYHLIKFQSINQVNVNNSYVRYKYDQKEQFYEYLNSIKFIPCQTSRYKNTLLSLVQDLLTCDPNKRLSFYQIYQHPFIKDLKIDQLDSYLQFYQKCEYIRDLKNEVIFTNQLKSEPPLISRLVNQKPLIQEVPTVSKPNVPEYLKIIMKKPQFSDSSFYNYWFQIQLDCLRCYILVQTTDRITILSKYDYQYIKVLEYFIKKMHLLILREMNNYLKSKLYQNQPNKNWENFLNQHQEDLFASEQINLYLKDLELELQTIFEQHCQTHLRQDSQLPQEIKQSLNDNRVQDPYYYFLNGYADAIQMLLQCIDQLIAQNQEGNLEELQAFKKLIYFCIDINFSFQSQTFKEQFQQLKQKNQELQPNDVIKFLGVTNNFR
ncbi:unnamed protein product [Paramecium octaurelia]|uniref:Protein kinase domain-containing protein n=1 Tax=Paramecium octaurelia TaxID=43137 RepID=A0A8S1U3M2_PAROT|nr:unnamed protein product [Paramecium octaurelia]